MSNPVRPSRAAWLTIAAAVALACGTSATPTPVPSGPPQATTSASPASSMDPMAVYAAIAVQVEAIRHLQPKAPITPVLIDEATLRANLTEDYDHENTPAHVAASQAILITLGLLPVGTSLRTAQLDLEAGQVIGYYSPEHQQLFVVSRSGGVGPTQEVTYAHEFTHQLQDQNFGLSKLDLNAPDQGDRSLARLALVEGDAVTVQSTWMTTNLTAQDLAQILADASDPAAVAALQRAPAVIRATSLFPYSQGLGFVGQLIARGGESAVDAAFGAPPSSTAQIFQPASYFAHQQPVTVALPSGLARGLGAGWTATAQDTLGVFMLRTWLTTGGVAAADAEVATTGWAGDRIELLGGPHGEGALAVVTRWDSSTAASAFAAAARTAITKAVGMGRVTWAGGSTTVAIAIAPSSATLDALARALSG